MTVRTENITSDGLRGAFGEIRKGSYVRLTIADTGGGIPPEVLPRIMDPFFSTKNADEKSGSGLGLSVVYSVIKDHNGFIDVLSTVDVGTEFHLYFPPTDASVLEDSLKTTPRGTERILFADDDAMQREVVPALLQSLGYTVDAVPCGVEAMELFGQHNYDLVILDTMMKGKKCGFETFQKMRQIVPEQKGILVSGTVDFNDMDPTQLHGINRFLRKPLDLSSLSIAVREVIDGREVTVRGVSRSDSLRSV